MILVLKSTFSSAHFYAQEKWDEVQNKKTFGRCYTPYGHGHNYILEVGFKTSAESWQQDQDKYSVVLAKLTDKLDHEHLNFVIPEFKNKVPTTENIAVYFQDRLHETLGNNRITNIKLFEMDNLWTEIRL